jgi:excisionase family DNA binding protein
MPATRETPPAIGTAEACEALGVSKDTLIRMAARGDITPLHKMPGVNGAYVFDRAEIEELAARKAKAS